MGMFSSIFKKTEEKINTYEDFWNWFVQYEQSFYNVMKSENSIESNFFNKIAPKLDELKDGIYFLAGMYDESTAELILTPDGVLKNIVFVEELIDAAPNLNNWRFTALKPACDINDFQINMNDLIFGKENMSFYALDQVDYPDEIDLIIVHDDFSEERESEITNGTYIFLDNYLGELNTVTLIDNVTVIAREQAEQELIPIEKLKSYLNWREKEFLEKYEGFRHNTEHDIYSTLEATLQNGLPLVAVVNSTILEWDTKASHPWILKIEIKYDGQNNNGMPDNTIYKQLNDFENEVNNEFQKFDACIYVGRETADSTRSIYFACKDFRKPSKILHQLTKNKMDNLEVEYEIYKDKYWNSFERFRVN